MRIASIIPIGLAAITLGAAPHPVAAQQQIQRPQVVTQFDDQTVRFLLADIAATWRVEQGVGGATVYRVNAEGELNFTLAPRACSPEGVCTGLMMVAIFSGVDASDPARLDGFINRFNDTNPTAKLIRDQRGVVAIQAYINTAYGISFSNAQAQFLEFGQNIVLASRALGEFQNGR